MSEYTSELNKFLDIYNIFDFHYPRSDESKAIISNEDLQAGFINRYYFREIGFETVERFKHKLKTQWLESIENFDKLLVAFNETINPKANMSSNTQNTSVYNDTPKNALDFGAESSHASNITYNTQTNVGLSGLTEIEALELYHDKLKDIVSEYYDTFDNLFMQIF
jgi:hypothetical protein